MARNILAATSRDGIRSSAQRRVSTLRPVRAMATRCSRRCPSPAPSPHCSAQCPLPWPSTPGIKPARDSVLRCRCTPRCSPPWAAASSSSTATSTLTSSTFPAPSCRIPTSAPTDAGCITTGCSNASPARRLRQRARPTGLRKRRPCLAVLLTTKRWSSGRNASPKCSGSAPPGNGRPTSTPRAGPAPSARPLTSGWCTTTPFPPRWWNKWTTPNTAR